MGIQVKNLCVYILMLVELLWQLWVEIVILPLFGIVLLQAIDICVDVFALKSISLAHNFGRQFASGDRLFEDVSTQSGERLGFGHS
jgi:hypothetical protein